MTQKSIKESISWQGVGLHSGVNSTVTIVPQEPDYGIRFMRTDVADETVIPAVVKYVSSTIRGTNIKSGGVEIMTVEHILSALAGLNISNILIQVEGPEIPILDGSARPFAEAMINVGIIDQGETANFIVIDEVITYRDEISGSEIIGIPADKFSVEAWIEYKSKMIGNQIASFDSTEDFLTEIAGARTFVLAEDLKHLADQGLIKGGDVENAVVLMNSDFDVKELHEVLDKLGKKNIDKKIADIKKNQPLLHPNELARHKVLDLIGDLRLSGAQIKGKIIAKKPGHKVNIEFAKLLRELYQKQRKLKGKPEYDPSIPPIYNAEEIKRILPHRYPFLLVDKITELSDTHVVGIKNVTINEELFMGHFPDNPVFPGVLQMEALAQTGGILALSGVDDPSKWNTYFLKMDSVKFKKMVFPGDTMILKMELLSPVRRGLVHMKGIVYVGDNIVSEGELIAQIVKRPD
ncbi:MAG: bifunctional UDP-3-O-[3-hydroxymyristoyl] N-acetylglucosamine deacetylase/3-hydroxyacyl-ACP dehydratase [Saprospiraceae bacterium]